MTDDPKITVLIAEDDAEIRHALSRILSYNNYDVITASDGAATLEQLSEDQADVVILDVMMPFVDGFSVCRQVRAAGNDIPILLLTARHKTEDKVTGLDSGADDFLPKPFESDELLARLRALLRRRTPDPTQSLSSVGPITLNPGSRQVTVNNTPIDLTRTEFAILEMLVTNVDLVLKRSLIYERIWGYDPQGDSRSLDVHIGYLRKKLEQAGTSRLIETVRGIGFVLRTPTAE